MKKYEKRKYIVKNDKNEKIYCGDLLICEVNYFKKLGYIIEKLTPFSVCFQDELNKLSSLKLNNCQVN
jgi:hypothetical protein